MILPRVSDDNHRSFDVFDLASLTWSTRTTYGDLENEVPNLGIGSTLSYHEDTHSMYLFGGWNNRRFSSDMYRVSMDTWSWERITIPEGGVKPSPRYLTGVLVHGDKICNFGGVGIDIVKTKAEDSLGRIAYQDMGAVYDPYADKDFGWNNEYYEFDVKESKLKEGLMNSSRRGCVYHIKVARHGVSNCFANFQFCNHCACSVRTAV